MARVTKLWAALAGLGFVGLLTSVVLWFVLLSNLCLNPRTPSAATQNTIPTSCHGSIVFITPSEQFQLEWLGPIGMLFMLVSFVGLALAIHTHKKNSV